MSDQEPSKPVRIELNLSDNGDMFMRAIRQAIRVRGGVVTPAEPACFVLVKGYHDSGTIDGVFGPYTEEYADWLLAGPLSSSYSNWTKHKLSAGPEET